MRVRRYYLLFILLPLVISSCATRPPATAFPRMQTYALTNTQGTLLGKVYGNATEGHKGLSGFHIINSGEAALMTRIALVEKAERSIDLQYFSSRDDLTGQLLLEAIRRAADRGVRVRLLLDDYYLDDFTHCAVALNANPHIEIRVFNPYYTRDESLLRRIFSAPAQFEDYDRRMHNKEFIVDNQIAVMGGRNLGDEYFDSAQVTNLRDIDVVAVGPVVPLMSASFDRFWNSDESFPLSALTLPKATPELVAANTKQLQLHWENVMRSEFGKGLAQLHLPDEIETDQTPLIWAPAEFVADSPAKVKRPSDDATSLPGRSIAELVKRTTQHEFIIFTPYFVPLDKGTQWLTDLVKRGVAVRIVTNSLSSTDMVAAQAGYGKYRQALVEGGVELYEIKAETPKKERKMLSPSAQNGLHAKIYMMDARDLVLGSFNLDPRSAKLNTEQALIIHSPALCEKVVRLFQEVSSPDLSYKVILAKSIPADEKSAIPLGTLAWRTRENGKIVYYDFSPHAGFLRRVTDDFFALLPIDKEL